MRIFNPSNRSEYIDNGPFRAIREETDGGHILRYLIQKNGSKLSFEDVIDCWMGDQEFRNFITSLLTTYAPASYVWETPPITNTNVTRPFEFVLISLPMRTGYPDHDTFAEYFSLEKGDEGVVTFDNLGKDALLIVPSPYTPGMDYSDLAAFLRNAPVAQHHALWRVVGKSIKQCLGEKPIWLSVAGGGVAWLHIRIDTSPKYYRYASYRVAP